MKSPLLLILCFWFPSIFSFAQFSGWGVYDSTNSSLPSSLVTSVCVGANNKVWIGTNAGLASFEDLIDWNVYTTSNSNLASNLISKVRVSPAGTLWYSTQTGVIGYLDNTNFVNFTSANSPLGVYPVSDFDFDGNILWVTTQGGGVFKYESSSWTQYSQATLGLPLDAAQCVHVDMNGVKLIGTSNEGIFVFNNSSWTRIYNLNSNIPLNNIAAIYKENASKTWFGIGVQRTDSSLLTYDNVNVQILDSALMNGIQTSNIRHVYSDPYQVKWIASNDDVLGGLIRYNDTTYSVFRQFQSGLPSNRVYETAMDDSSNLWIATFRGLAAYNEENAYLNQPSWNEPKEIMAWPNPVVQVLNFELAHEEPYNMRVYNALGLLVKEENKTAFNKGSIDVSLWSQGVYFVHISQANSSYLLRFIKQ